MAYLQEQIKILKHDKRLREINLKNGSLSQSDYEQYLSQLTDLESQSEKLVLDDSAAATTPEVTESIEEQTTEETPAITPPNSDPFGSGF